MAWGIWLTASHDDIIVTHLLQDVVRSSDGTHSSRRLLEGVEAVVSAIGNVTSVPSKVVSGWVTDQIAPSYWTPNSQIKVKTLAAHPRITLCCDSLVKAVKHHLVLMILSIIAEHVVKDFVMTAVPIRFLFHGGGGAPLQ